MSDLIYKEAQDAQRKLFYSLTSTALAALALSVQFSPRMGSRLSYMLLTAWGLLFVSSAAGGWRLAIETTVLRNQYLHLTADSKEERKELVDLMNKQDVPFRYLTKIQIWALMLGLLTNLIFAAANYIFPN